MAGSKSGSKHVKPSSKAKGEQGEGKGEKVGEKRGWDEIESIFDDKKKQKKSEAEAAKKSSKKYKSEGSGKPKAKDLGGDWVDDGLGGVYNSEGFTGRTEDGCRIFKAHVIQHRPDAGRTELCPFDCDCCYM